MLSHQNMGHFKRALLAILFVSVDVWAQLESDRTLKLSIALDIRKSAFKPRINLKTGPRVCFVQKNLLS